MKNENKIFQLEKKNEELKKKDRKFRRKTFNL